MRHPCQQTFALRLKPRPAGELDGEIEHVLSGERQAFGNGDELLRALLAMQQQHALPDRPPPG